MFKKRNKIKKSKKNKNKKIQSHLTRNQVKKHLTRNQVKKVSQAWIWQVSFPPIENSRPARRRAVWRRRVPCGRTGERRVKQHLLLLTINIIYSYIKL